MQLFLLPYPHGAVGRVPWKTVPRTTAVPFLTKMSALSVSVVMPHQLSANPTRIRHVDHQLQPYKNLVETARFTRFISMLQEDFRLANKFPEVSTLAGPLCALCRRIHKGIPRILRKMTLVGLPRYCTYHKSFSW